MAPGSHLGFSCTRDDMLRCWSACLNSIELNPTYQEGLVIFETCEIIHRKTCHHFAIYKSPKFVLKLRYIFLFIR
ncbi:unnamed protein product [Moneuplotes crassus]|uniref:Uncharacterized protein n=1 Tax=Euplotes crassus TaxID=5936 RepID=A0AAD1X3A6_EUPCR|nr:unnamed protein product [Moneuplotes crassus]